jgi:putative intracellular protease/amidase
MSVKVLMVITGADRLKLRDGTARPTGYWAEEVAVPHELFRNAGLEVARASRRAPRAQVRHAEVGCASQPETTLTRRMHFACLCT